MSRSNVRELTVKHLAVALLDKDHSAAVRTEIGYRLRQYLDQQATRIPANIEAVLRDLRRLDGVIPCYNCGGTTVSLGRIVSSTDDHWHAMFQCTKCKQVTWIPEQRTET